MIEIDMDNESSNLMENSMCYSKHLRSILYIKGWYLIINWELKQLFIFFNFCRSLRRILRPFPVQIAELVIKANAAFCWHTPLEMSFLKGHLQSTLEKINTILLRISFSIDKIRDGRASSYLYRLWIRWIHLRIERKLI